MSSGKNFDMMIDLNVLPPEEESKGIKHSFDLNEIPPVDDEVDTCDLSPAETCGVVGDNDVSRRDEYQVSERRGKRKLTDTELYDTFADKLMENFEIPSAHGILSKKGATKKKFSKSGDPKKVVASGEQSGAMGSPLGKRKRMELVKVEDDDEVVVRIPKTANVFTDPSSIDGHVRSLIAPLEAERLKKMSSSSLADEAIYTSYRTLAVVLQLSKALDKEAGRATYYKKKVDSLEKDKKSFDTLIAKKDQEIKDLEEKAETLRQKKAKLQETMLDLCNKSKIKARGEWHMEYKFKGPSFWSVDEELAEFEKILPKDYAKALEEIFAPDDEDQSDVEEEDTHQANPSY